jgi:hypothetical protein
MFIAYDAAANQWREKGLPFSGHGGHTYDNITMDFHNHCFYWFTNDDEMYKYTPSADNWNLLSQSGSRPKTGHGMALEYFPEMKGLFHVYEQGAPLSLFSLETKTWQRMSPSPAMGAYHNLAEYSRVHNIMLFGGGNYGERLLYKMDASGAVTKIAEPPVDVGINKALLTADPVTGDFLVLSGENSSDSLYVYHVNTDVWETLGPNPGINNAFCVVAQISTYGVICFLSNSSWPVLLYKYADGAAAVETGPLNNSAAKSLLSITPNPARGRTTIKVRGSEAGYKETKIRVYNVAGSLCSVASLPAAASTYTWNTAHLPTGIYIVQAKINNKIISQRIILTK